MHSSSRNNFQITIIIIFTQLPWVAILKNGRFPYFAQAFKIPPSGVLKLYMSITQNNIQILLFSRCIRVYSAGPGLNMDFENPIQLLLLDLFLRKLCLNT